MREDAPFSYVHLVQEGKLASLIKNNGCVWMPEAYVARKDGGRYIQAIHKRGELFEETIYEKIITPEELAENQHMGWRAYSKINELHGRLGKME